MIAGGKKFWSEWGAESAPTRRWLTAAGWDRAWAATRPTRRRASSTQLSAQTVAGCRSDRLLNSGDGSELFIVDRWSLEQSSPGHAPGDDDGTCVCGFHSIGHASAHC